MRRSVWAAAIALPMVMAACSNSGTPAPAAGSTATSTSTGAAGTVNVAQNDLGEILTNADGRTVYLFEQDTDTTSTCMDSCASTWPALIATGKPTAGDGVDASLLDTNDAGQVTYAGHPLYLYSADQAAGDTNGEGIGDLWYAVSPTGAKVEASSAKGY
jgi:predicted lipoprotein with Yx(FWY)xxD motif